MNGIYIVDPMVRVPGDVPHFLARKLQFISLFHRLIYQHIPRVPDLGGICETTRFSSVLKQCLLCCNPPLTEARISRYFAPELAVNNSASRTYRVILRITPRQPRNRVGCI